jgi:hypothetical protein
VKSVDSMALSKLKYPKIIDSLGVQGLYDKTKWVLYCIYCDDTCVLKKGFSSTGGIKTFGELDLRFTELRQVGDTVELDFRFYNDTIRCDIASLMDYKKIATGVGYKKNSDSILYYTSSTTMHSFWEKGPHSRYETPLQPEVISYIMNHKESLNPWFLEEAKRKKIIK